MPLTLGLNVSNDHPMMISISYHHFYVLFIPNTMITKVQVIIILLSISVSIWLVAVSCG